MEKKFCEHNNKEIRRFIMSNGLPMYKYQCLECGAKVGQPIKKEIAIKLTNGNIRNFDEKLYKIGENRIREYFTELNIERMEEKDEFTRWYYDEYLKSDEWRERRKLVLERANHICEGCLVSPASVVHHTNYDNVGDEVLFDLVALCHDCHRKIHNKEVQ